MNQSEFLAITCNSLKAREKRCVQGAIGFASHWLKNWREIFKPIAKCSNRNSIITLDTHLKTVLSFIEGFAWFILLATGIRFDHVSNLVPSPLSFYCTNSHRYVINLFTKRQTTHGNVIFVLLSNPADEQKLCSWYFLGVKFAPCSTFQIDYAWSGVQLLFSFKQDCYLLLNNSNGMFLFLWYVRNGSGFAVLTTILLPVK